MISDQKVIMCEVLHPKSVAVSARMCRYIDISAVKSDMSVKSLSAVDLSSACELTPLYNNTLASVLDRRAAAQKTILTIGASQPWFSDQVYW